MPFKNLDLEKYNKRLLAIIGSTLVIGVALFVLTGVVVFAVESISRLTRKKSNTNNGVVINNDQVVDTNAFTFHQELSILKPYQLDTIHPIFIVPVGQKDQKKQRYDVQAAGLAFESYSSSMDYEYSNFTGLYNNFVLVDYTKNLQKELFQKKVALTEWSYLKINSSKLIVIKGTDTDTNKDGRLNEDDFQSLFVFDLNTLKTRTLKFENETVRSFEPLKLTSKIYVRTGKDINKNNKFNSREEPTDLYFYDLNTGEHETLVSSDVKTRIRKILN